MICPCQDKETESCKLYSECCEPLHLGKVTAQTPDLLMRSRYSAFDLGLGQYIFDTQHIDFRNGTVDEYQQSAESTDWCRLEVLESSHNQDSGKVNFKAYFIDKDKLLCLHEISNFVLDKGQWFYTDGDYQPKTTVKISRNQLCPCHSGLKAKKCHLK